MANRRNRRGMVLAWTAIVLIVMIGVVGLSIDWGWATLDAQNLQNAADAAALAGALTVKTGYHEGVLQDPMDPNNPYGRARELSLDNYAAGAPVDVCYDATNNNPSLDVVIGRWFGSAVDDPATPEDERFEPLAAGGSDVPNAVKVATRHVQGWRVNRALALNFGPIFGVQTANVSREAIAITAGGGGAGLICLDPSSGDIGLSLDGTTIVNVMGGSVPGEIYVNSHNSDYAVTPGNMGGGSGSEPNPTDGWAIRCAGLNTCGEVYPTIKAYYENVAPPERYSVMENLKSAMPDPLWNVPAVNMNDIPYGALVKVQKDPTTLLYVPVLDSNGVYIPAKNSTGQTFDVSQPTDTITQQTVANFGQLIDGRQILGVIPGYYPGGFKLPSSGSDGKTIVMLPGVYAVGGGTVAGNPSGLILNGGALDGVGVMIYVTNSKRDGTGVYGKVNIQGNYDYVKLTEYEYLPGDPEEYKKYDYRTYQNAGLIFFQDRRNKNDATVTGGSGNMRVDGTLYFHCTGTTGGSRFPPSNFVPSNDNSNAGPWQVKLTVSGSSGQTGVQLITDRVVVAGNSVVTISYDGRNFMPADIVYLVK